MLKILILFFGLSCYAKHNLSYYLLDIDSGKVLSQKNAEAPSPLASVSKILSSHYSLSILGADFQFTTKLMMTGSIKEGVLNGDLYLVGGGDPYLTSAHLFSLALALNSKKINSLKGNFYYDSSVIPEKARISPIGLEDQPDNPALSGLNVEFNRFLVQNSKQLPLPKLDHIKIKKSKANKGDLEFQHNDFKNAHERWSQLTGKKGWSTLPTRNSGLFTAEYFRYLAMLTGVRLPLPQMKTLKTQATTLATHQGLPLIELTALVMEYSNNLIAEAPFFLAKKKEKTELFPWLKNQFPNVPWKKTKLINASGLTHENVSSPLELSYYLKSMFYTKYGNRTFPSLLTTSGNSGNLRRRLKDPELAFKVWAKTGSLHYVDNVAGYLFSNSGKKYAFAILINDPTALKELRENNLSKKSQKLRKKSRTWVHSAKSIQDSLLRKWILEF